MTYNPMVYERLRIAWPPFECRHSNRNRVPHDDDEARIREKRLQEARAHQIGRRFFDEDGPRHVPVTGPCRPDELTVGGCAQRRALVKEGCGIKPPETWAAMLFCRWEHMLKMLPLVLRHAGIHESAYIGMLTQNGMNERRTAAMQAAYEHDRASGVLLQDRAHATLLARLRERSRKRLREAPDRSLSVLHPG
jgi:hypothetical protein